MFISISLRNLTFNALCLAFVLAGSVDADAQTQRRQLRKLRRERDLEELRRMQEGVEEEGG